MASKKGKSICIFAAKGGVGKTTILLNLAGIYETMEKHVLIIDLDLSSGSVNTALNLPFERTIYTLTDDLSNNRYHNFKDYVQSYDKYIDVLASPKDPRQASKIDAKYLDIILDRAAYLYDVVLIDTNHVLSEMNLLALDKVDKILFTVTNDPLDLKNMKSLISIFTDLGLTNYKILLNNSRDPFKNYFSLYDMKSILKANIDYTLSNSFFIKNIDNYIMDGKIISLEPKFSSIFSKDYAVLMTIAADFYQKEEGENHE